MNKHIRPIIDNYINRYRWKKRNKHNHTHLISVDGDRIDVVSIGRGTYGGIYVLAHSRDSGLKIGSYCSIAPKVVFMIGAEHPLHQLSTFPFKVHYKGVPYEALSRGDIIIDDDVWIGYGAQILSGVHIGQGAVIAAGAVVNKDVEPYTIVGGVPAGFIRKRFDQSKIDYFLTLDFGKLDEDLIKEHIDEMYMDYKNADLDEIIKRLDWFPKKGYNG